ncbi:MAG: hypothetical protein JO235_14100 [Chroococcidiopsidaceae cyanobacterium CP_BM_RX_35]|nr:hypothetical protein [Chroococcidiopsidaceae cyanobacterium CP_BM_RX_35]
MKGPQEARLRPLAVARYNLDTAILLGQVPWRGAFALEDEFVTEVISCAGRTAKSHSWCFFRVKC